MITKLLGLLIFAGSLGVVFLFEGGSGGEGAFRLLHWPAMVLTGLGPFGIALICFDNQVIGRTLKALFGPSVKALQHDHEREAVVLHRLSRDFYNEGTVVFERFKGKGMSEFVLRVIRKMGVRVPTADVKELLQSERDKVASRLIQCSNVVGQGMRLSPSIGMLGTILGMVRLLSSLQDPSHIGSEMSLAMLTTFYGLFFSLVLWTPLHQKIERMLDVETEAYDQVLRWLEVVERRKPINYFAESTDMLPQVAAPEREAA